MVGTKLRHLHGVDKPFHTSAEIIFTEQIFRMGREITKNRDFEGL